MTPRKRAVHLPMSGSDIRSPAFSLDRRYRYLTFSAAHAAAMKSRCGVRITPGGSYLDCIGSKRERAKEKRTLDRALKGRTILQVAATGRGAASRRTAHLLYTPARGRPGKVSGVSVYSLPVSTTDVLNRGPVGGGGRSRRKTEKPPRYANNLLRAIVDAGPTAIIGVDSEGRVFSWWNQAAESLFGVKAEEAIGRLFPGAASVPQEVIDTMKQRIAGGEPLNGMEIHGSRPDGTQFDCAAFSSPLRSASGRISGGVVLLVDITERKHDALALRESEVKFRSIVENALAGMFSIDESYRFLYANDVLCKTVGFPLEELVGRDFRDFLTGESKEMVADRYRRRQRGEDVPPRYELTLLRRNGETRWAEISAVVVRDPEGKSRTMGQLVDITDRKMAERDLQMFRFTVDQAGDAIFWIDRDGRFLYVNEQACASLGYSFGELTGLSLWDINPNLQKEGWYDSWDRYRQNQGGGVRQLETRHRRKNGTLFPVEVTSKHLWFGENELHVAVVRNITDRKRAEEALKEKTDELDRYFTSSLDLLCIADTDGYFRRVNPEWERTLGYTVDELEGMSFLDLVHPDDAGATGTVVRQLQEQKEVLNFENRFRCKDGTYRWFEWRSYPHGKLVYAVARDVTERKNAEEALRASLHEKEILLKEIHHRVKNNLQIVASMLNLQAEHTSDPQLLTQLREAQSRVYSIAMVHQKLYRSPNLAEVDFSEYLRDVVGSLLRTYAGPGVKLDLDVEELSLGVDVAIPLGLIINELISNALKHAFPEGRRGTIRLVLHTEPSGSLVLTVHDDGVGIPADIDPFHADTLGMSLVSILIQQLGGKIELERSSGTRFTVTCASRPA